MSNSYDESTLEDWQMALRSDQELLLGFEAIASDKGVDANRRMNIDAAKKRIAEAQREIARLSQSM